MHVFSDLMPYICTFDGCQHKLSCFPSRSAWANHEFQEHRFDEYWACPECSRKSYSALDWEHHLINVHNQKFSGPNLVSARNAACRISPKRAEEEECLLCRVVLGKPHRAFVKHVCRHMEDIALMALPTNAEEDSDIGSISTNHTSNEDNDTSKDLHIDKDRTIKCICGFGDNDGIIVCCERCDTWQHTECYYHDEKLVVPTKGILGSINHSCVDCKPRLLDSSVAIKRQVNWRAEIGPHSLFKQPNEQHPNAPPEKPTARIMSPNDTSDCLIRASPQVERTLVSAQRSPSPDNLPPSERSPTPERMSRLKRTKRRRRPKPQASEGDAVLIGLMGGLHPPELAMKAGEEPLSEEGDESTDEDEVKSAHASDSNSEESTDEDGVGSKNGSGSAESLRTAVHALKRMISPEFHQYVPSSNESTEARLLETPNLVKQDLQDLRPQEPVKETRRSRRRLTKEQKEKSAAVRKIRACNDCRKAKIKVSVLAGCGVQYCC